MSYFSLVCAELTMLPDSASESSGLVPSKSTDLGLALSSCHLPASDLVVDMLVMDSFSKLEIGEDMRANHVKVETTSAG
jgi:hypothetical protein